MLQEWNELIQKALIQFCCQPIGPGDLSDRIVQMTSFISSAVIAASHDDLCSNPSFWDFVTLLIGTWSSVTLAWCDISMLPLTHDIENRIIYFEKKHFLRIHHALLKKKKKKKV